MIDEPFGFFQVAARGDVEVAVKYPCGVKVVKHSLKSDGQCWPIDRSNVVEQRSSFLRATRGRELEHLEEVAVSGGGTTSADWTKDAPRVAPAPRITRVFLSFAPSAGISTQSRLGRDPRTACNNDLAGERSSHGGRLLSPDIVDLFCCRLWRRGLGRCPLCDALWLADRCTGCSLVALPALASCELLAVRSGAPRTGAARQALFRRRAQRPR